MEAGGSEMQSGMGLGAALPVAVAHGHLCFLPAAGVPGPPVRGTAPAAAWGNAALEPDLPAVPAAHASGHPGERGGVSKGWQRLVLRAGSLTGQALSILSCHLPGD